MSRAESSMSRPRPLPRRISSMTGGVSQAHRTASRILSRVGWDSALECGGQCQDTLGTRVHLQGVDSTYLCGEEAKLVYHDERARDRMPCPGSATYKPQVAARERVTHMET